MKMWGQLSCRKCGSWIEVELELVSRKPQDPSKELRLYIDVTKLRQGWTINNDELLCPEHSIGP
jgi:hypothetical protein